MPDDVAIEKVQVLEKLGAKVERVRPGRTQFCAIVRPMLTTDLASIVDEKQFVVSSLTASR
jgi:cysteine synthase A